MKETHFNNLFKNSSTDKLLDILNLQKDQSYFLIKQNICYYSI